MALPMIVLWMYQILYIVSGTRTLALLSFVRTEAIFILQALRQAGYIQFRQNLSYPQVIYLSSYRYLTVAVLQIRKPQHSMHLAC